MGQAAVYAEWRLCLGPEWPYAEPLLRQTGELGSFFPRCNLLQSPRQPYRPPFRVVHGGPDRFQAVTPDGTTSATVTAQQLAIYELHHSRLASRLAQTLRFHPAPAPVEDVGETCRIGTLTPSAGHRFPVFLAFPREPEQLRRSVAGIAALHKTPFLLVTPTLRHCDTFVETVLMINGGMLVPLSHTIALDEHARWQLTDVGRANLERFVDRHAPRQRQRQSAEMFPTPADATWSDVRIRFLDGETISAAVGEASAVVNYTQFGMADGRNGRPTVQWELLRVFASEHGTLDWSSRSAGRRRQKQREVLARQLRTFFRIEGDPFVSAGNGWQTRFSLTPDA